MKNLTDFQFNEVLSAIDQAADAARYNELTFSDPYVSYQYGMTHKRLLKLKAELEEL